MAAGDQMIYMDEFMTQAKAILVHADHQPVDGGDLSLQIVTLGNLQYYPLDEQKDWDKYLPMVTIMADDDMVIENDGTAGIYDIDYPIRIVYYRHIHLAAGVGDSAVTDPYLKKVQDLELVMRPFLRARNPNSTPEQAWTNGGNSNLQPLYSYLDGVNYFPPEERLLRSTGIRNTICAAFRVHVVARSTV